MIRKLTELEQRERSNTRRIEKLEGNAESINRLATAVEVMAREQKYQTDAIGAVRETVHCLTEKVDALERKPGKRWEMLADKVLLVVAGAFLTWLLLGTGV